MSALGGHEVMFQVRRDKLLALMLERMKLQGSPITPPFRLFTTGPTSPPTNTVDLVVKSIDLNLRVGTNLCDLTLTLHGGIVRLPQAAEISFLGGHVTVTVELINGVLLVARIGDATIDIPTTTAIAGIPNFATRANAELNKALAPDRKVDTMLLAERTDPSDTTKTIPNPIAQLFVLFGKTICLDSRTVCTYAGGSEALGAVASALDDDYTAAFAMSAESARQRVLCPSLIAGLDPETPTPPQCGTGELNRDQGDRKVRIGRIDFDFRDGYIDISGDFSAWNDSEGWATRGGTFWQKLLLHVGQVEEVVEGKRIVRRVVVPTLDPPDPVLKFEVHLEWWVWLGIVGIKAAVGAMFPLLAVIPFASGRGDFLAPGQPLAPQGVPPSERVTFTTLAVSAEGLLFRGYCDGQWEWNPRQSGIRIRTANDPQNRHQTGSGPTTVQVGKCAPQEFTYIQSLQDDKHTLTVETDLLVPPLTSTWTVNDLALATEESTVFAPGVRPLLKYRDTIHTAAPPPNGVSIPDHPIELSYWVPRADWGSGLHRTLLLTARQADLNYKVVVKVRVTDALGRVFDASAIVEIVGDIAEFDGDYHAYMYKCLVQSLDVPNYKVKKNGRAPRKTSTNW